MKGRCANCWKRPTRPGQRTCKRCHADDMKARRAQAARDLAALKAELSVLRQGGQSR